MDKFKGTKGKWTVKGDFKCSEIVSSYGSVCAIARQSSFDSNIDSEAVANAKLISCAPELLEMLSELVYCFTDENNSSDELELLNQANNLIKYSTT